jgi:hypothetical protein
MANRSKCSSTVDDDYSKLGVCDSHFLFDQNQLYKNLDKQLKNINLSIKMYWM